VVEMKSPIGCFGGKGRFIKKLMPLIPPHRKYVEVFGGGASLLFAKQPTEIEVYNDIDERLVNFFSVLKNNCDELYEQCYLTLYSRSEFLHAKQQLNATSNQDLHQGSKKGVVLINNNSFKHLVNMDEDLMKERMFLSNLYENFQEIKYIRRRYDPVLYKHVFDIRINDKMITVDYLYGDSPSDIIGRAFDKNLSS